CWIGDICLVLRRLPEPIYVTDEDLLTDDVVEGIMERLQQVLDADLQRDIDSFEKTYLLRNRVERIDEGEGRSRMGLVTRRRQHYLNVPIPAHRRAIKRLMLSDHNLSVERLRYPSVAIEQRLLESCACVGFVVQLSKTRHTRFCHFVYGAVGIVIECNGTRQWKTRDGTPRATCMRGADISPWYLEQAGAS
ncbi:hypothetical protein GGX14DRAFT_597938, partial [Mycena pura]